MKVEGCLDINHEETQEHIFRCPSLSTGEVVQESLSYENIFTDDLLQQIKVAGCMKKRITRRKEIIDARITPVSTLGPSDP